MLWWMPKTNYPRVVRGKSLFRVLNAKEENEYQDLKANLLIRYLQGKMKNIKALLLEYQPSWIQISLSTEYSNNDTDLIFFST
jgi:hypothetical protein